MKKLFYGGTIITMNESMPQVEAVLINDNRIEALGDFETLSQQINETTEKVNLNGKTMMPGFFDPHLHPDHCAFFEKWVDSSGFTHHTKEEVMNELKKAVAATPKGKWIASWGYDYALIPDLEPLTKLELDKITTDHPLIVLIQSMHTMFVNSMALEKMNITKDTPDPAGGYYQRDENGEPNGVIVEMTAEMPFGLAWLADQGIPLIDLIADQYKSFKKHGITSAWSAGMLDWVGDDYVNKNKQLVDNNSCPIRLSYSIPYEQLRHDDVDPVHPSENTERFQYTGVKLWYDGSPYSGSMLIEENYLNTPLMQDKFQVPENHAGMRIYSSINEFRDILEKYHKMGLQIAVHAQGDRAVREVLNCFEDVLKKYPRSDHRHRLEHCALISKEDYVRAAELGITLSYHINHILYYGDVLKNDILGEERANVLMATKTALDNNIIFTLHSDGPMFSPNPLLMASTAVLRQTRNGTVLGADQCLSVHEALKAITINAAWQLFREKDLGSIEIGKLADFVILKNNPYEVMPEKWKDIEIVTTYLDGIDTDTLQ